MEGRYNLRSPAVKRLMREAQELAEPTEQYHAQPLEDNLFEWHFTIRGPTDTEFVGGVYHGRIILPPDYPMKPPSIMFLTPNGRFECFTKICLSISKHHPESWQPSWSIRTALLAIIGFMPSPGQGAIGSLDYTKPERVQLAKKSLTFSCEQCGSVVNLVLPLTSKSDETKEEIKNLAAQLSMTAEKAKPATQNKTAAASGDQPPPQQSSKPAAASSEQDVPDSAVSSPTIQSMDSVRQQDSSNTPSSAVPATSSTSSVPPIPAPRTGVRTTLRPTTSAGSQSQEQRSRSCVDSLTYWSLLLIGALLAVLILRRVLSTKMLMDMWSNTNDEL